MNPEKIHTLLAELHRELADDEKLPADLAEEARTVVTELTEAMPADEDKHGAAERLEEIATRFETEHPTVANAARQIAVALGRMGI